MSIILSWHPVVAENENAAAGRHLDMDTWRLRPRRPFQSVILRRLFNYSVYSVGKGS